MTLWFGSDTHFEHFNIVDKGWRPFDSVHHMNRTIVDNFKSVIDEDDTLILVGDLCMGKKDISIPLLAELPGKKFLVPGNHDPMHPIYEKRDWKRQEWADRYKNEADVTTAQTSIEVQIGNQTVDVCHFPYSGDHTEEDRFPEYRPVDNDRWLIHGHVHDLWKVNGRQINVGVDVWDFFPVHVDTIKEIIRNA